MFRLVAFVLFLVLPYDAEASCPSDTIEGAGNCYKFVIAPTSFFDASAACMELGGHLASTFTYPAYWLGGTNLLTDNTSTWLYTDGKIYTYTKWANGYPLTDTNQCMYETLENNRWLSGNCDDMLPYVCEIPINPQPKPTTCKHGWSYDIQTNRCYIVRSSFYPFWHALRICKMMESTSNLVSIHSDYENKLVQNFSNQINQDVRIGLHDASMNSTCTGTYIWTDGTPTTYTNFVNGHQQSCGKMLDWTDTSMGRTGEWYTGQDTWTIPFVCAYNLY